MLIFETIVEIFSQTRYDFSLNQEVPFVDPFKYLPDFNLDLIIINLSSGVTTKQLYMLGFRLIEVIIIVTQANYNPEDKWKLREANSEDNEGYVGFTQNQRYELLTIAFDFVSNYDKVFGTNENDKLPGISLFCSLFEFPCRE